jgi:regulator of replication initiation timing
MLDAIQGVKIVLSSERSREARITELESKIVALRDQISELERRLTALDSENSTLRSELGKSETSRSKLLMQTYRMQENMKALEAHRANLTSELYDTKRQLEQWLWLVKLDRRLKHFLSPVKSGFPSTKVHSSSSDTGLKSIREAWAYLRRWGIRRFTAASMFYLGRKLDRNVNVSEVDYFLSRQETGQPNHKSEERTVE